MQSMKNVLRISPNWYIRQGQRLSSELATTVQHATPVEVSESHRESLFKHYDVRITKLPSGFTLASIDTNRDVSQLSVVYNLGTRNEDSTSYGVVQRLRNTLGIGTMNLDSIDVGPMQASIGAHYEVEYSRENMWVSLACSREDQALGVEFLGELSKPVLESWTVSDLRSDAHLFVDDMHGNFQNRLMELLHQAAYGTQGLGNQLVWDAATVNRHSATNVMDFADKHIVSGSSGMFGLNVDHDALIAYATDYLGINEGKATPNKPAGYRAGELRESRPINTVFASIAAEGASLQDIKGVVTQLVLSALMFPASGTLRALHRYAKPALVTHAVAGVSAQAQAAPVNIAYSDTGLFGLQFFAPKEDAAKVIKAGLVEFRKLSASPVDADSFARAKKQVLMEVLTLEENTRGVLTNLGCQVISTGNYNNPHDVLKHLDAVTPADVEKAAKSLISKPLSYAVVGDVEEAPYLEELSVA